MGASHSRRTPTEATNSNNDSRRSHQADDARDDDQNAPRPASAEKERQGRLSVLLQRSHAGRRRAIIWSDATPELQVPRRQPSDRFRRGFGHRGAALVDASRRGDRGRPAGYTACLRRRTMTSKPFSGRTAQFAAFFGWSTTPFGRGNQSRPLSPRPADARALGYAMQVGLLHPTGANDVLSYPPYVREFFLSFLKTPTS